MSSQQELEKRVKMLEYILDNIKATVYAKSADGKFIYINQAWADLTGHQRSSVIGKTDADLNPEDPKNHYWAIDSEVIRGGEVTTAEEHIETPDGEMVLLSVKVPLKAAGDEMGICGISIDITHMKQLEREMLQAKENAEKLLLNILPKSVADELMLTGKTEPISYDNVAVLFSDIVEFTNISATMTPNELINELNELFTTFDNITEASRCERIKTIGDAYLAVCGIPNAQAQNADHIVEAAVKIIQYLKQRQSACASLWKTKIGIHCGPVVGGVVGVKKYIYDIFGSTVNIASRLQAATKIYHVDVLISDVIYNRIQNKGQFCIREIDTVRVKGDSVPLVLYEVFDGDEADMKHKKLETLTQFHLGLNHYRTGNFQEALNLFTHCRDHCPEDELPHIYIRRCSTMMRIPPGPDWAGISGI